jgi:hypothetical protein
MKVINNVNQSNNYQMFKTLEGNRTINKIHVERLKKSFEDSYLLSPILVNKNFEIIDGQHRFNAAKSLKLPINFIIVNDYGLKEVQLLNTNMSNWKKEDYLQAFCDLGYPEYIKMRSFMEAFPDFGIAISEQLLTNSTGGVNNRNSAAVIEGKSTGRAKNFQQGNFEVSDLALAYENAEKLMMFKPYYNGFNRVAFSAAMIGLFKHPNYNHAQMIRKIAINPAVLCDCSNVSQYKILLEDIYNFKSREKVSLRF